MSPDEFRRLGHELIDWVADYRTKLEEFPVMSTAEPGSIRAALPTSPPEHAEGFDTIVADLERVVLPGITHWTHPSFFAYFPSNAGLSSVLADVVSTGLGVQGMSWQTSPAATELEEVVMAWLRQMLDLPETFEGVIHDTASTATLVALVSARERATDHSQTRSGLQAEGRPLAVYTSDQSHSSVEKAALLAGIGRELVRAIPSDDEYAMRADALAEAIERDRADGVLPCAVVATCGTTATTALDPIASIAEVAERAGAWLHVDAAMAGSAMVLPECRPMWAGVERADSLVLNPHKWLGVAFDLTAYFVRDSQHLVRVMSTNPSVLQTSVDGTVKNFRDWGIPLGRRFRALKLWFLLREQGVEGIRKRLRRDLANAAWLAERVTAESGWRVVAPVPLQTVCIRHEPDGMSDEEADAHNLAWVERLNRSGAAYLTPTVLRGRRIVRVSIGSESTERRHVEQLWAEIREAARASEAQRHP